VLPDVYTTVTTSSGLLGTAIGNVGFCIVAISRHQMDRVSSGQPTRATRE
jgi:hypothetical protein